MKDNTANRRKLILFGLALIASVLVFAKPLAISMIDGYQAFISPHKGYSCAFHIVHHDQPSCSEYGKRAIHKYGVWQGYNLIRQRLSLCREAYVVLQAALSSNKLLFVQDQCSNMCESSGNICSQTCADCTTGIKQWVLQVIHDSLEFIRDIVVNLFNSIKEAVQRILVEMWQGIKNMCIELKETVEHAIAQVFQKAKDVSSEIKGKIEKTVDRSGRFTSEDAERMKTDIIYAYMSECAYGRDRCNKCIIEELSRNGWKVVETDRQIGNSIECAFFKHENKNKHVIAFRGTEPKSLDDWKKDLGSARVAQLLDVSFNSYSVDPTAPLRRIADQASYKLAVEKFAKNLAKKFGSANLVFTGHSKGGGEALWASKQVNSKAVVFNPRSEADTGDIYDYQQARGYYLEGEFLHYGRFRDNKELVQIPYKDASASTVDRHLMEHLLLGMEEVTNNIGLRTKCN